ncbi:uncharacterized protein LOC124445762 isoform X3 [Xenia sp. Carnegie-2017]|uniref:uncharacterized protein LOC124445762 isoform X3 n=1 Tax=Xenia sp. Carnegie-2017 TaxID=2897299 RepID=UPI001F037C1F|nr:uncharacterized protein LOC124445762 isoform X3 [Xenia sp. Carnegie-2017]
MAYKCKRGKFLVLVVISLAILNIQVTQRIFMLMSSEVDKMPTEQFHKVADKTERVLYKKVNVRTKLKQKKERKILHPASPAFQSFNEMIRDDKWSTPRKYFPLETKCPYIGARKPEAFKDQSRLSLESKCQMHQQTLEDCIESIRYFGKPKEIQELKCNKKKKANICMVVKIATSWEILMFDATQTSVTVTTYILDC